MSDQEESEKKVGHRIEPKQQPIDLPNTSDSQKHDEFSNLPKTVNAQYFKPQVANHDQVESGWGQEAAEVQNGRRNLLVGLLVLAAFFSGCVVWALVLVNSAEEVVEASTAPVSTALSFDEKLELRNATVAAYLSAGTLQEKALYVRSPRRVLPLMDAYYKKFPLESELVNETIVESPVMGKEGVLWRVSAREKNSQGSQYLLVETQEDGTSQVDWETDVVYQPSDWKAFKALKSTEVHTFRAQVQIAQLDGFHGFEFSEYNKFRCFKVTLPGSDDYLWAYTEIGSEEDVKMVSLITSGGRRNINTKRVTLVMLELRYPENGQSSRCVHLSRLVQAGWLH
ncbi:MAG: hypothetical protein ACI9FG_002042 [Crocinitomicaceae bacterium]|jgi:hypothetical protein